MYSHILAKAYGWSLEYIANLPVLEAMAKLQEIMTEEQLEKEFLWSTSQNAFEYDQKTKMSHFKKLPRPYWMLPKAKPLPKIKMRKDLVPMGNVIKLDENYGKQKSEPVGDVAVVPAAGASSSEGT